MKQGLEKNSKMNVVFLKQKKYMPQKITFAFVMAFITTCSISFIHVVLNFGFLQGFFYIWFRSWSISFVFAFLIILFISHKVQVMVNYLLKKIQLQRKEKSKDGENR